MKTLILLTAVVALTACGTTKSYTPQQRAAAAMMFMMMMGNQPAAPVYQQPAQPNPLAGYQDYLTKEQDRFQNQAPQREMNKQLQDINTNLQQMQYQQRVNNGGW